jgi:hypothetical protein
MNIESMNTQPEALRLAKQCLEIHEPHMPEYKIAAELRRLYEVNADMLKALKTAAQQLETDAIFMSLSGANGNHQAEAALVARAAIAKAMGEA